MSEWDGLRIAVAGAHGTGKTTLAKAIVGLTGLHHIQEVARSVAADLGIDRDEPLSPDKAIEFQNLIFDKQWREERKYQFSGFVSDRSLADQFAYLLLKTGAYYMEKGVPGVIASMLSRTRFAIHNHYDVIFVTRPLLDIQDDGFRSVNRDYQEVIDKLICSLVFNERSYHVAEVCAEDFEERWDYVHDYLLALRSQ